MLRSWCMRDECDGSTLSVCSCMWRSSSMACRGGKEGGFVTKGRGATCTASDAWGVREGGEWRVGWVGQEGRWSARVGESSVEGGGAVGWAR